ncbi:MAG: hypothetical protein GXY83_14455 [Rhodopirellula sp.]|nr:hypothetical protein [Rhodopirellula sp.]
MDQRRFLGIDIGSTTWKAVVLTAQGAVLHTLYRRTQSQPPAGLDCSGACQICGKCNLGAVFRTLDKSLAAAGIDRKKIARTAVTGSQVVDDIRRFVDYDVFVSEVSAHVAGANHFYPDCQAVLDVGGQDSKAMRFDGRMRIWMSKMSGICAAGTGAFLDAVAAKLSVPVEEMADHVHYDSTLQLSSVCAVLGATSVNKFKNRYPLGDVIAAACRAQARTIISGVGDLLRGYTGEIIFQGGVASNRAVAHYLEEITGNRILVPELNRVMGALGAARIARDADELDPGLVEENAIGDEARYGRLSIGVLEPAVHGRCSAGEGVAGILDGNGNGKAKPPRWQGSNGKRSGGNGSAGSLPPVRKSAAMRTRLTRQEFLSRSDAPLVWRNLFFPPEILNALGVRMLTMETYAALRARNGKWLQEMFDKAARKGFSAETCSFLRVLEGDDRLPNPAFVVSTSEPCQQAERILADLVRDRGCSDRYHLVNTPIRYDENSVESIAEGLEAAVVALERSLGIQMEPARLAEACELSNQARDLAIRASMLRFSSPPLLRGAEAVLFGTIFSQLWGKKELVELQQAFLEELAEAKEEVERHLSIDDTHRLVWLHLPPFYSSRLMDFIEVTCNAPIVFEEVNFVGWDALDPAEPYRSLARKLLTVGFLDPELRVQRMRKYAPQAKIDGFLLYNHMFGRCSMADSCFTKHLRDALEEVSIPLLVLDGDCLDETTDPCSTYTKVKAFVEALCVKKYGSLFGGGAGQMKVGQLL